MIIEDVWTALRTTYFACFTCRTLLTDVLGQVAFRPYVLYLEGVRVCVCVCVKPVPKGSTNGNMFNVQSKRGCQQCTGLAPTKTPVLHL